MNQMAMVAGMEVRHGLRTWTSTHQGWPGVSHCWGPKLPAAADTKTESPIWSLSVRRSASYLVADWWWHWIVPTIEGVEFCSYWTRHSTYRLAFLHAMLLPKLPFMKKENALYTIMVFHTALLLINKLTSQKKECSNRPIYIHGICCLIIFPIILKQLVW